MVRRVIYVVLCFVLLLASNFLAASSQEEPTFVIVLLDETSAETSPFGTRTPVEVRSWAVQLLEALADRARKTQSDFRIRIMKFSFDDENMIKRYPTLSLSPDNRVLLKHYIYDNCFGRTHIRTTKRERLRATLCKVLNDFEVNAEGKNRLFLISDTRNGPRIHDTWLDSLREWLLGWLGCRFWRFSTVLERYREFGSEIHALFVPIRGLSAAWLAEIVRQTRGRFIEEEQCIPRSVWTVEEILKNVASRLSVDVSLDPDNVLIMEGQRMITLKSWLNYDDQKLGIREGITWEECEKIDIDTLKATVFLDDKEFGRLEWDEDEKVFVPVYEASAVLEQAVQSRYDPKEKAFVCKITAPCTSIYKAEVRISGEVARWIDQKLPFSFSSNEVDIGGAIPNVDVGWSKGRDAFLLELSYQDSCGQSANERETLTIDYDHEYLILTDQNGSPTGSDEISFDNVDHVTLLLKPNPELRFGTYRGLVKIHPTGNCRDLTVGGKCIFEQKYTFTVLEPVPKSLTVPNLWYLCSKNPGSESVTEHVGSIRLDGMPENWDPDNLEMVCVGFPSSVPWLRRGAINGTSFGVELTIPSCSAVENEREIINSDSVDRYLELTYTDPSSDHLFVFKVTSEEGPNASGVAVLPVELKYKEKWIRVTEVEDCTKRGQKGADRLAGVLHKGDLAFSFSLEYSSELSEEDKCLRLVYDSQDLKLLDKQDNLIESEEIIDSEFFLRVHQGTAPGRKIGELEFRPCAKGVLVDCNAGKANPSEMCRYPYEFEVPYRITIQNEELNCQGTLEAHSAGYSCVSNLELDLGSGEDAPNWGKLIPEASLMDSALGKWKDRVSIRIIPSEILPPFSGTKKLQLILEFEEPERLSITDWETWPDEIEGQISFQFAKDNGDGVVQVNKSRDALGIPLRVEIPRPPLVKIQVKDCSEEPCSGQNSSAGELDKGDIAFDVKLEYLGQWDEVAKLEIEYPDEIFECYDLQGTLIPSRGTIHGNEFTLRVHTNVSPGKKSGNWSLGAENVYLHCGKEATLKKNVFTQMVSFGVPYNIDILDATLFCGASETQENQASSCDLTITFGTVLDAPSSGSLSVQVSVDGMLSREDLLLGPPFSGVKKLSVDFAETIDPLCAADLRFSAFRDGREIKNNKVLLKITRDPKSPSDIKLLELQFVPIRTSPSSRGGLRGMLTATYDYPEAWDGPSVEVNHEPSPLSRPIDVISSKVVPSVVEIRCEQSEINRDLIDDLYFLSSETVNGDKNECNERVSIERETILDVYAASAIGHGVHRLMLNPDGLNCRVTGESVELVLRVRRAWVALLEAVSTLLAVVLFALPLIALLIAWILYLNSGYDSFREYIDELRWRWGKWIYIVPPISVGLAFLASVAWFLAAACIIV